MAHQVNTDNTQLIYSINDAVHRIATLLEEHEVNEEAPGPNEVLEALDSEAWDAFDTITDLLDYSIDPEDEQT